MHPTSDLCKSNGQLVYKHIKFERNRANRHGVIDGRVSPTPSNSARVTCRGRNRRGIGVGQIRNTLKGDIKQRRPLVNWSTCSRDISFSKASRGRVGLDWVGSGRVELGRVGLNWVGSGWVGPRILRFLRCETGELAPRFVLAKHFTINSNRSNVLDDAPLLFTELYFTFCALLNLHEVFALVLLNGCAASATFYALKSRNHLNYSYLPGYVMAWYLVCDFRLCL